MIFMAASMAALTASRAALTASTTARAAQMRRSQHQPPLRYGSNQDFGVPFADPIEKKPKPKPKAKIHMRDCQFMDFWTGARFVRGPHEHWNGTIKGWTYRPDTGSGCGETLIPPSP